MATGKRIFLTGGNGYLGSTIIAHAILQGYQIHALSRTQENDAKLRRMGATPIRGDLTSLDVIRRESAAADYVLLVATAYSINDKPYDNAFPVDKASINAVAEAVRGTNKPVVFTSGTLAVAADPNGAETDESSPKEPDPINNRGQAEEHALRLIHEGVRIIVVRLAAYTYGRGGSGVKLFMSLAAQRGNILSVNGGRNHITSVHVDDAAKLYLLAMEGGKAGDIFNGGAESHVTAHQVSEAMASTLGLPIENLSYEEAKAEVGVIFATFLSCENRASGAKARKELGWQPAELGILQDIHSGSYQAVARSLRWQAQSPQSP